MHAVAETYYAPPERATRKELAASVESLDHNPVISAILQTAAGLVAVLNENRQVLAVNDAFLKMLGIRDADTLLGLRPGEVIRCVHAGEMPAGCGTTQYCSTCGAAIAIVTCLEGTEPVERKCAATVERDGAEAEMCFQVRACPVGIEGRRHVLLFMQDITKAEQWAALERIFFHDIGNIIQGLTWSVELLEPGEKLDRDSPTANIKPLVHRLANEIAVQRALMYVSHEGYPLNLQNVRLAKVLDELQEMFVSHPLARGCFFRIDRGLPLESISTDATLLLRMLTNLLVNAFEATDEGGEVRLALLSDANFLTFSVWNSAVIPEDIGRRVFQRHFSTKSGSGRGLGCYAVKLFGERFLGGKVGFRSSAAEGTTFWVSLPLETGLVG